MVYDPKKDPEPYDVFGPLSEGNYMRLPEHVKMEFITEPEDIVKLD